MARHGMQRPLSLLIGLVLAGSACHAEGPPNDGSQADSATVSSDPAAPDSSGPQASAPTTAPPDPIEQTNANDRPIDWVRVGSFPGLAATRFAFNGHYFANDQDLWWASRDGITWNTLDAAPPLLPSNYMRAGTDFEIFHTGLSTWAVTGERSEPVHLLEKKGGTTWVEVPIEVVPPPAGVDLAKVVGDQIMNAGSFAPYTGATPRTVVVRDGILMTIPSLNGVDSGLVSLDRHVYAVEVSPVTDLGSRYGSHHNVRVQLWRSADEGRTWTELGLDVPGGENLTFGYLTAGHDRLMLTLSRGDEQEVWTSRDGTAWDLVEQDWDVTAPAPPIPTDFGWIATTVGHGPGAMLGAFEVSKFRLYLSPDGSEWQAVGAPRPSSSVVGFAPMPVDYAAGIFVRQWVSGTTTTHVGMPVAGSWLTR
jgi:hypothetical protein